VAIAGWILDKSAAARAADESIAVQLEELAGLLYLCPVAQLEQLYSSRSARHYDELDTELRTAFRIVDAPPDVFDLSLSLQRDLAHHHGMWHRTPIPDLLIAVTALHHGLGVIHVDADFDRIAEVRPLVVRRLRQR
jgi:predicted nucleic acid-binding protein